MIVVADGGPDDEVMRGLHDRAEKLRNEGPSPTLLVQLLADLSILDDRLVNAERQRLDINTKVEKVLDGQVNLPLLRQSFDELVRRLGDIEKEIKLNTAFRLRFEGGSMIAKLVWVALGGISLYLVQKLLGGLH